MGTWLDRWVEGGSRIGALLCGYFLLLLALLVGFEVVARKLLGFSLQGADEIGGYVLAIQGAIGFSYALLRRAHTRIDFLITRFGEDWQRVLNVLAIAMMAAFAVFMAWRAGAAFFETLEYRSIANSPLATPLWIPQSLWLAGLVLFAVAATVSAIWSVILLTRDPEAVNRRFGVVIRHESTDKEGLP